MSLAKPPKLQEEPMSCLPTIRSLGLTLLRTAGVLSAITWALTTVFGAPELWLLMGTAFATYFALFAWKGERLWRCMPKDEDEALPLLLSLLRQAFLWTAFAVCLAIVYAIGSRQPFDIVEIWIMVSRILLAGYVAAVSGFAAGAVAGFRVRRRFRSRLANV